MDWNLSIEKRKGGEKRARWRRSERERENEGMCTRAHEVSEPPPHILISPFPLPKIPYSSTLLLRLLLSLSFPLSVWSKRDTVCMPHRAEMEEGIYLISRKKCGSRRHSSQEKGAAAAAGEREKRVLLRLREKQLSRSPALSYRVLPLSLAPRSPRALAHGSLLRSRFLLLRKSLKSFAGTLRRPCSSPFWPS